MNFTTYYMNFTENGTIFISIAVTWSVHLTTVS